MASRFAALAFFLAVCSSALADDGHHTLWVVKNGRGTVYLVGSLHALRLADSDLPAEALRAYAGAKALVMEVDLSKVGVDNVLSAMVAQGTLPNGETLERALGADAYEKFSAYAKPLGVDPAFLSHFQPWFAAMMLQQVELARLGFAPEVGVDVQFARRARADHKDIIGLETVEEQFGLLASMSLDEQRRYVLYSLSHTGRTADSLRTVVSAWRTGDTKVLEQLAGADLAAFPDLHQKLTVDRNRKWLPTIVRLLDEDNDYLVVVGALHLVGTDGIVDLLQRGGYQVEQH